MQYLMITEDMTLKQLIDIVGERNVDAILSANGLERSYNIGKKFYERNAQAISDGLEVDYRKKLNTINQFVGDYDIYEKAALGSEDDWIVLSAYNCFTDAMRIPDSVVLPSSVGILGDGRPVPKDLQEQCSTGLLNSSGTNPHSINPEIFSQYSASYYSGSFIENPIGETSNSTFEYFKLPWDKVFLYSSLNDEVLRFPVYPEGFDDGASANYEDMPDMLYQYEPWKVYKSSGPREITFTFKDIHRDMWTGDHRDGMANQLIRGCESNCYPKYNGALVNYSLVTMYINGNNLITGVMTDCKVNWSGPIGLDGFYLVFELSFTISEISPTPLDITTVRNKRLIQ